MDLPALPPLPMASMPNFVTHMDSNHGSSAFPPLPATRQPTNETRRALDNLNGAVTQSERIEALQFALAVFSHKDVELHNYEIQMGADKALCLKLGYIAVTSPQSLNEICLICQCLLQIYECSSEQRKRSFRSIGATELVPLLIQILMRSLRPGNTNSRDESKVSQHVVHVLRTYAKMESAKTLLIKHDNGKWLGKSMEYCAATIGNGSSDVPTITLELLGLVKDLTFRTPRAEKQALLSLNNGFLGNFLIHFCSSTSRFSSRIVEWFTAVVWNLVLDKHICCHLVKDERRRNFTFLRKLLEISRGSDETSPTSAATSSRARRNAISAVGNILAQSENRKLLSGFAEGTESKLNLVPMLMELVLSDSDSVVRRRAMRTIRCLVCSTEAGPGIRMDPNMNIPTFLISVIGNSVAMDDENDRDMQIQACQVICATVDQLSGSDWPRIETALLQRIETTTDSKLIQSACNCLSICVRKSPWQRGPSCFSEMLWTRLESVSASDGGSHGAIASFLLELARAEGATKPEARAPHPSGLTRNSIVNTLTSILSHDGDAHEEQRRQALEVVVLLMKDEVNKQPLADNENLLTGLVNLCLTYPEGETKASAKQAIIDLVPSL